MRNSMLLLVGVLLAAPPAVHAGDKSAKPNIILLVADDLGYRDLSCFGSTAVKTPHLDRMAAQGIKLTRFYDASAVCSPTRASILTGRYPLRFGITRHFNDINGFLPESATTVAKLLRDAGYVTGHVGKWHLGGLHVGADGNRLGNQPGPRQHGFQEYCCQIEQQPLRGKMGKERRLYREGGTALVRDDQRVGVDDPFYKKHLTDLTGDYAVEFIKKHAAAKQPFFLNVWWLVPHAPYEPAPEPYWSASDAKGISHDQRCFRSMVAHMDAKIGAILKTLDDLGIADNTIVIFTSDNGAAFEGDVGNLRGGKGDLHEGGLRVPGIARWPGQIPAGKTSQEFTHTNDLLPTLCEAAGAAIPKKGAIDGLSLLSHLRGGPAPTWETRGTVFWQLDHYTYQRPGPQPKPAATAVARKGKWKLLAFKGKAVELFDMDTDDAERNNLLSKHPEIVESLSRELSQWITTAKGQEAGKGKKEAK